MYYLFYIMMFIGFLGCSLSNPDLKMKIIGILLAIVNLILFWR